MRNQTNKTSETPDGAAAHGLRLGLVIAAVAWGMIAAAPLTAAPPRDRSLTYDPTTKRWVERSAPEPGTPEGDLRRIRTDIKTGHTRRALKRVKKFKKAYGEDHPLYPTVLLARAEARIERRDYDKAHAQLQSFLDRFPGLTETADALRLEFVIAEAYLRGAKRKILGLPLLSGENVAFRILDEISTGYPELEIAPLAIKTKADYLFARGEHDLAEIEFARLVSDFPNHRYHQYALRQSARSALASFRGTEYDEAALIEAEERFDEYRMRYPAAAEREGVPSTIDGIQTARAVKDFEIGRYYERTDHTPSAVFYYRLVEKSWPGTFAAERAHDRLVLLGVADEGAASVPDGHSTPAPDGPGKVAG